MSAHHIVIFGGLCNVCESTVRFIIRRDPAARFRFVSAQSKRGKKLCEEHAIGEEALETVVLLKGNVALVQSDAILEIARELGGVWTGQSPRRCWW